MPIKTRVLNNGMFNRQAVCIPSGNIFRVEALLRFIL